MNEIPNAPAMPAEPKPTNTKKLKNAAAKSWKTTAAGALAALIPVAHALQFLWDGDPKTVPNWEAAFMGVTVFVGFLFSRDSDVSSEEASK